MKVDRLIDISRTKVNFFEAISSSFAWPLALASCGKAGG
jgi:hypothetical protein